MSPADLHAAFDPTAFRNLGTQVLEVLTEHLQIVQRREGPVLPWREPSDQLARWPADFPAGGGQDPVALLRRLLADSNHLQHPRYVGHQVTSPLPLMALMELVGALINNASAIYEMGPASTAMEQALVCWMSGMVGFDPAKADGVLTHGGSAGNLTALLAARQASAPHDIWEEGIRPDHKMVLVAGDQAHYSARRSAQIMGLGGQAVRLVACDDRFRMRPDDLDRVLDAAQAEGATVMAVVASAGSTATGAIDPLEAIAERCEARGLWFHVDGAHGGGLAVSSRLRPRLAGIARADSTIVDAHKMLLVPALSTFVLFRDGNRSFETFSQQASYLFGAADPRDTWFDLAQRTLECTKRMLSWPLYSALKVMGTDAFAQYVEGRVDLAACFAEAIRTRPHWELAVEPEMNIVCFRYLKPGVIDLDAFQERARATLVQEGSFHLVKTRLRGATWLRTTLINPLTTESDLEALLARVEALA